MIPVSQWKKESAIPFFATYISPIAREHVETVLESGFLSEGFWVRNFEEMLEEKFKLPKDSVVAVNSGTSALHLALATLGIGGMDEVLLPAQTFVATGLAVKYTGATPVFCDIRMDGNIDPEDVVRKITPRTKAVIAVNWAGKPCDPELVDICNLHGVKLIVDAAQSLGYGMIGDITCLSFQATKHLTTGDGGAVICKDPANYERARKLSWFGINKDQDLPDILGERVYNLHEVGFKYHMNNVAAAIGCGNLVGLEERQEHRSEIAKTYFFNINPDIARATHTSGAFWAYPIYVDSVGRFSRFCYKEFRIPVSILHRGIDRNAIFGSVDPTLKYQRIWEQHVTHLPVHHEISVDDALWICDQINQYV